MMLIKKKGVYQDLLTWNLINGGGGRKKIGNLISGGGGTFIWHSRVRGGGGGGHVYLALKSTRNSQNIWKWSVLETQNLVDGVIREI